MSSTFKTKVSDYLVSCPDIIEVDTVTGDELSSNIEEGRNSSLNHTMQQSLHQFYYDSSTVTSTAISDTLFESSTDHQDYEKQLATKTSAVLLQHVSELINGSNDQLAKVSIESSKDVHVGQTILNGNVLIRPRHIVPGSFSTRVSLKDECPDHADTSRIGIKFLFLNEIR